jgi:TRAP-type C4-dicarboxylate transport system substrate-binding protein
MTATRCRRLACLLPLAALLFAGAAQAVTLKIATVVPAGTDFIGELRKAGEAIREETGGRVELKLFPGGVMGNDSAVLRKMKIGQLHGAVVTASGLAQIHPDAQVYSMPFVFRSHEEVAYVRERIDPVIRERLREEGYVVGGISEGGFTYLFSRKPIRTMDDLSGKRVWVPEGDEITARMFKNVGSQSVSLPISDVFTSLQTGLLDTVTITPSGAIALQWHSGVSYQTDAPLLFLVGMLVLDERAFERVDEGDRETVLRILRKTFDRLDEINRQNDREAMEALREQGIELVEPERPPAERRWQAVARETLDTLEAEGEFDGALLERVRGLVREYREQHGG